MNLKLIDSAIASYGEILSENDIGRLEFFRGLWELQAKHALHVADSSSYEVPDQESVLSWYWDEKPFFLMAPVSVGKERFVAALEDCSCYLTDRAGFAGDIDQALRLFDWRGLVEASDLSKAGYDPALYLNECCELAEQQGNDPKLPGETVLLVVSFALRPMLQSAAMQVMKSVSSRLVQENTIHSKPVRCPACGSTATASFVGETPSSSGNGRLLYCAICGTEWEFERIRCSRCGTRNQGHLHYFHLEGDDAHRIYSCDECGDYLRTVFQADLQAPFSFEVEDVVMAKLDMVANDPCFSANATKRAADFEDEERESPGLDGSRIRPDDSKG